MSTNLPTSAIAAKSKIAHVDSPRQRKHLNQPCRLLENSNARVRVSRSKKGRLAPSRIWNSVSLRFGQLREFVQWKLSESFAFVVSFTVHLILMLTLALWILSAKPTAKALIFSFEDPVHETELQFTEMDVLDEEAVTQLPPAEDRPQGLVSIEPSSPTASLTPSQMPIMGADWLKPIAHAISPNTSANPSIGESNPIHTTQVFVGSSTANRSLGNRRSIALSRGASTESEDAVDRALMWLAAHQSADGSWSTFMSDAPCKGRCRHGSNDLRSPKRIGATGLALLCFLGAGHTHREGNYRDEVYKALMYLNDSMQRSGKDGANREQAGKFLSGETAFEMYEHGIATLALCEAYQMTDDRILKEPCQLGINYLYSAQASDGSWGYHPKELGDLSIVGWQIMAIKSAMMAKLTIRPEVVRKADAFLNTQQSDNGAFYGYRGTQKEPGTTAIGLLLRLYRGWNRTDPRITRGAFYITELGPSSNGIYYDYYATQLLFHLNDERFARWNPLLRDYLVRSQETQGHESGSWFFPDSHFNEVGGRLYCTAMATLTLEVYYRYMPIYEDLNESRFEF